MFGRNGSRAIASIGLAPNNGIYTQIRLNPDPHGLACVDPAKTLIHLFGSHCLKPDRPIDAILLLPFLINIFTLLI